MSLPTVAVIGAGPAVLACGRWLLAHGFAPVLLEAGPGIGGLWREGDDGGIWPGMVANTSRVLTAFSDLDHAAGTPAFPAATTVAAYLARYAAQAGLDEARGRLRLHTRVEAVRRDGAGWRVTMRTDDEVAVTERFDFVVVASGRFRAPALPSIPGIASFTGAGGVSHTAHYRGAAPYAGRRVLVAGSAISALEIASELAVGGAAHVVTAARTQRYVLPKFAGGIPTDHLTFTRYAAVLAERFPAEVPAARLKALVLDAIGRPEQYGALPVHDDLLVAGITRSQWYLPLVAEGRITARPWIAGVDGRTVHFTDGSRTEVDAIVCGTGFRLDLPMLDDAARTALHQCRAGDLHDATFHPALAGLAVVGMYDIAGPLFPVLELQARRVAYAWSGLAPLPDPATMADGIARRRAKPQPRQVAHHRLALSLARSCGVEPDPADLPALARALWFGAMAPVRYRLAGPDALPDAPQRLMTACCAFGAMPSASLTTEQRVQLAQLREPVPMPE